MAFIHLKVDIRCGINHFSNVGLHQLLMMFLKINFTIIIAFNKLSMCGSMFQQNLHNLLIDLYFSLSSSDPYGIFELLKLHLLEISIGVAKYLEVKLKITFLSKIKLSQ
jgi:hypothetical protein